MKEQKSDYMNNGQGSGGPSGGMYKTVVFLSVVLVLLSFAFVLSVLRYATLPDNVQTRTEKGKDVTDYKIELYTPRQTLYANIQAFKDKLRIGDYSGANQDYQRLLDKNFINPNDRALAVWIAADLPQKASGDVVDALQSINELKTTIVSNNTEPFLRAMSINTLANIYYGSVGRDPRIFDAIFTGKSFEDLRVEGDAFRSMQNLYEWSYELQPASITAVLLARWHVIEALERRENITQDELNSHILRAEQLLSESSQLIYRELAARSISKTSRRYASYLYWGTYVRAALAELKGEPYLSSYREEYQSLFRFLSQSPNLETNEYIPFAHWLYAHFLVVLEGDSVEAKKHLKVAVDFVNTDLQKDVNEFLVFVRNTPTEPTDLIKENNLFSTLLIEAARESDVFRSFIEEVNPGLISEE